MPSFRSVATIAVVSIAATTLWSKFGGKITSKI